MDGRHGYEAQSTETLLITVTLNEVSTLNEAGTLNIEGELNEASTLNIAVIRGRLAIRVPEPAFISRLSPAPQRHQHVRHRNRAKRTKKASTRVERVKACSFSDSRQKRG